MDFKDYLVQATRTYTYNVKVTFPLTDAMLTLIEQLLLPYDPVSVTNPKKAIFQSNPVDFPNVHNVEVYSIECETNLPISSFNLQKDIAQTLKVSEKFVVVYGSNDPRKQENEKNEIIASMDEDASKKGLTASALLNDPDYVEANDTKHPYGTSYNNELLKHLDVIRKEKEDKYEEKYRPFSWLAKHETDDTFNKEVNSSSVYGGTEKEETTSKYRKVFKDKNGKVITMTRKD